MAPTDFFEALPRELVPHVLSFLSGFDLRPLSYVNKTFNGQHVGTNSECWARHAPHAMRLGPYEWRAHATNGWTHVQSMVRSRRLRDREAGRERFQLRLIEQAQARSAREQELLASAKHHYFESVSVRFPGLLGTNDIGHQWTDVRVTLPDQAIRDEWTHRSFSFDLWMALLPGASSSPLASPMAGESCTVGGVVFSAQSSLWKQGDTASPLTANLVHVDELGGLYCSVASGAQRALAALKLSRWYHVALTFDRSTSDGTDTVQRVYLDGECIDTQHGALQLPAHWSRLREFQLGTGFMDSDAVGRPQVPIHRGLPHSGLDWITGAFRDWRRASNQFRGNYAFLGLLDEFRLWRGTLSSKDVERLARGRDPRGASDHVACITWSLTVDADYRCFHGDLWAATCTRPTERGCQHVRKAFHLRTVDELRRLFNDGRRY